MDRHNKNRETLCSWVFAFIFYLNLLHQLVMLGPKQPQPQTETEITTAQRRLGQQSAKDHGRTMEELRLIQQGGTL